MDNRAIDEALARYLFQAKTAQREGAEPVHLAWFAELPFCIAEGDSPAEAAEELGAQARRYLDGVVRDGGSIPVPIYPEDQTRGSRVVATVKSVTFYGGTESIQESQTELAGDVRIEAREVAVA